MLFRTFVIFMVLFCASIANSQTDEITPVSKNFKEKATKEMDTILEWGFYNPDPQKTKCRGEVFGIKLGMKLNDFINKFPSKETTGEFTAALKKSTVDRLKKENFRSFTLVYSPEGIDSVQVVFKENKVFKVVGDFNLSWRMVSSFLFTIFGVPQPGLDNYMGYANLKSETLAQKAALKTSIFQEGFYWNYPAAEISCHLFITPTTDKASFPTLKVTKAISIEAIQ